MSQKDYTKYHTRVTSNTVLIILLVGMFFFVSFTTLIGQWWGLFGGLFIASIVIGVNFAVMANRAKQYLHSFEVLPDGSITFVYYLKDERHEKNIYFENLDFDFMPIKGDVKLTLYDFDQKFLTINYTMADHKKLFKKLNTTLQQHIAADRINKHRWLSVNLLTEPIPYIYTKTELSLF